MVKSFTWISFMIINILAQLFFISHVGSIRSDPFGKASYETNSASASPDALPVRLRVYSDRVIMSNHIVSVTFSNPVGEVIAIKYGGMENLLDTNNRIYNRGYWDVVWNGNGGGRESMFNYETEAMNGGFNEESLFFEELNSVPIDKLDGTSFKIIVHNDDQAEISFNRIWNSKDGAPLNVDKRFIMRRGSSGFYAYGILERGNDFPASRIDQIRIAFKLNRDLFDYMAISDKIQKVMPSSWERSRGKTLNFKEAVLLKDGEVDDKYQYSTSHKDNQLHGWIDRKHGIGFWIITASSEFRAGGPLKQELTSHCGPTALSMFASCHYTGLPIAMYFEDKEPWKKVFGPVFIYLNAHTQTQAMWEDAKEQKIKEIGTWPYEFLTSQDFPRSNERGTLTGRLFVRDESKTVQGANAYVGLAAPGDPGSWQYESKGYQFWTQADVEGKFNIQDVRPGNYSLFAWVPGFIGDYKYGPIVTISPGFDTTFLGNLTYEPPRTGATLWDIGYPDRTASEFNIPNPNPLYYDDLFNSSEKFRQYGLWNRYGEMYPSQDLVYTVGSSDYSKDWFFAQVTRTLQTNRIEGTTWQISFQLTNVEKVGNYTLRLAIAAASEVELQVRVNNYGNRPLFTTGLFGTENVIARHGIHGIYRLYSVSFSGGELFVGKNIIYLTQTRGRSPFRALMYDYIRLEAPSRLIT